MNETNRPRRVRQSIHLTEVDLRRARFLADQHDDGNLSRLVRRLIREEIERNSREAARRAKMAVA